jgi:hypothetical protein
MNMILMIIRSHKRRDLSDYEFLCAQKPIESATSTLIKEHVVLSAYVLCAQAKNTNQSPLLIQIIIFLYM